MPDSPDAESNPPLGPVRPKWHDVFSELDRQKMEAGQPAGSPHKHPAQTSRSRIIGKYKLLHVIGEGGMGQVWMAEQAEPVFRRVALKLIAGTLSGPNIARFEAERQAPGHDGTCIDRPHSRRGGQPKLVSRIALWSW